VITGRDARNLNKVAEKCYEDTWNRPHMILGMTLARQLQFEQKRLFVLQF
jgi:hypothetical protein